VVNFKFDIGEEVKHTTSCITGFVSELVKDKAGTHWVEVEYLTKRKVLTRSYFLEKELVVADYTRTEEYFRNR
jgi:hypothetical protein